MDPILSQLPSIHVTLIGIFGAFICGLGIYVLQKIHEVADAQAKLISECAGLVSDVYLGKGYEDFLDETGGLDWEKASDCIKSCARVSFRDEDLREDFDRFNSLLGIVFYAYPFLSGGLNLGAKFNEGVAEGGAVDIGSKRLKDLEFRVSEMYSYLTRCEPKFLELSKRYDNEEIKRNNDLRVNEVERRIASAPGLTAEQIAQFRESQMSFAETPSFYDYSDRVKRSMETLEVYRSFVIPKYRQLAAEREKWGARFASRKMSVFMLLSVAFVLFFGVFLPPFLLWVRDGFNVCLNYSVCWSKWYSFMLLVSTALPYFVVGAWCAYRFFPKRKDQV